MEVSDLRNNKLLFGTLFGLGVLGAFMAKKKAAKKVAKKAAAKKKVAKAEPKRVAGVMSSRDMEEDEDQFEDQEDDGSLVDQGVIDAHGNAGLDEPTSLDKPTQI